MILSSRPRRKVRVLHKRNDGLILTLIIAGKKAAQPAPKAAKGAAKDKATSKDSSVTNGVAAMKISDVPPPKSKGLDVIKEFEASASKRSVSFVVVGMLNIGYATVEQ